MQPNAPRYRGLFRHTQLTRWLAAAAALFLVLSGVTASQLARPDHPGPSAADGGQTATTCDTGGTTGQAATAALTGSRDLPAYQQIVLPTATKASVIAYDGARLVVRPTAVRLPTGIGITPLTQAQLPKLDSGMTNVTAKPRAGYRFTPHPMTFAETIEVTLPYDPALVTTDFTPQDIYTYWYDEAQLCWQVLQRVSVDEVNHTVTSLTDHFTDMINATVTVPEHPEGANFNPNQIKGIQAADPGAGVNLISPPEANNQGDNRLSYPIEVPPGRLSLQPQLSVAYNSSGGNGWMGVGWDLATPAVMVETRWGVPRYSGDKETETYLLNGEELTPVAHRGVAVARSAEKVFHTRVENAFARIVRHGTGPTNYSWEVTDKSGNHWLYGGAGATLADAAGDGFLWGLREVHDTHGNVMRYSYVQVDDPGVDGGSEPGRNLYVKQITYTGRDTTDGRYKVTFLRDRELNEPLRLDKSIDARGGFKKVTADRLRRIDVTLDTGLIRRYQFDYTTGAFLKTLLHSISQFDANGALFNKHEFSYFDDVRDGQGQYQAFRPVPWTTPGDGLSQGALNLTPERAGDASAINATTNTAVGGHLYVGVGTGGSKAESVGVKVGFNHAEDEGVLALIDVDGDSLPDKVFRSGGAVKYRKNLSGPTGTTQFSATATPLSLPGIQGESTNSLTLGVEAYAGPVAAQLDYVTSFNTQDQYFTDVNGDGITDLVTGSSVLFGRIGAGGTPVYGVSGDTPVPIGSGQIDTAGLFGNFAADRERLIDSFPLLDSVRRWVAPFTGTVKITGGVKLSDSTAAERATSKTADGVRVAIQREDSELWSDTIGARDNGSHTPTGVDQVGVTRGDRIYFRVQSAFDGGLDQVDWDPQVSYVGVPDPLDVNGLPFYRYQASSDFTLGGRTATVKVPLTGTMHLSGDLTKTGTTSDDVTVIIARDGTPVLEQTLAGANANATVPVNLDVPVTQGQVLTWRVKADSPIDLTRLAWIPRAFYTAASGVDRVTDDNGNPFIDVFPPFTLDMYPVDGLTAPQGFLHVSADSTLTVTPTLNFNFGSEHPNATVTFTVKKRGALLAKRTFTIANGVVTAPPAFTVGASDGDDLFFDFSTLDVGLRSFLTSQSVDVDGSSVDSAFHSAAPEGAFPQPYRGWAAVGYNGNRDRATQPIVQNDLVVDENFKNQLPSSVDPQAQKDAFAADPRINPPKVAPFSPLPRFGRWGAGEHSWVARTTVASSRLGVDSIALPTPSDFDGATGVPRLSRSQQISLTGSAGGSVGSLGGSIATGDSTGQVDFLDMNGDHFPDVVSAGGIQYTDPTGALGATRGSVPDGAVRHSTNESGNASAGSAARTISTGRGYDSPPGDVTTNTAESGNDMPPLGFGGQFGGSKSDGDFDLMDINGDDLPDRVYANGQVALNLGYHFGGKENWRNPAALNAGSGSNFGVNIGFNTDFYGFAGGASFSQGRTGTAATLMDMNGDGLMDRVFKGNPILVSLNTGNGFQPPVPFKGSLEDINGDRNASLGGGAYFTFSICFIAICIIINPGANFSTGAGRTEQVLRDINGDGYTDHLSSTKDNQLVVAENTTDRTNLLRSVARPLGASIDFDYTRDGNTYDQPQSKWVLSRVAVNDGQPGDGQDEELVTYQYSGGTFNRLEREFLGYATVLEQHRDHGNADAVYRSVTRDYRTDSYYTKGLLRKERTSDGAGHPFTETEHTYAPVDIDAPGVPADLTSTTSTIFPQLTRTDRRFFEGQAAPGKTTFTTMEYDRFGNVTRSFDAADAGTADDVDARIQYTAQNVACQSSYIVGLPDVIDVSGGGTLMRHRESTIDCATGNVSQVRATLAGGQASVTDLEYFADGNLKSVTGPPNAANQRYRLDYTYDTVVSSHVESIKDSFGYTSTATHNFKFGTVESTTDYNHQVVRNTYDAAGRMDSVTGPYETAQNLVTIDFEYHPEAGVPYSVTRHIDREADGSVRPDTIDTITFIDGLKRTTQTKKDAAIHVDDASAPQNAMVVSGRVIYDFLGRAVKQYYPISEPKGAANTTFNSAFDSQPPTVVTFDVLDRSTSTTFPDATTTTLRYGFGPDRSGATQFESVVTDANNKSKRTYTDVRQLTTSVKEFNAAGGQPTIWTSYRYDALNEITAIVDDHNNTTSATYDNFGRRTIVDSPDSGRTETVFDLAGNPIRKITAKLAATQQAIEYDYDFNRLRAIRYPVFTANNVTYTYGAPNAPNNAANRITNIVDGAGTLAREYGPLGEVVKETRTTPAQGSHISTFVTQYRYDTWNRMMGMTYPDGEVLTYHYNSGGQVDTATGVKGSFTYHYLTRLDYDKFEQRVLLDTGNGTQTRYTFNPTDRRLDNLKANLANGYVFQNLNYTYDNVGNVLALANDTQAPTGPEVGMQVGGPSAQTFSYDDLYRLTHAEGTYQPRTPRTDRYRVDISYDSIQNITNKSQVHEMVSNGNVTQDGKLTYNYGYAYAGPQPHAATTIGIYTVAYDANGNQISRDQQPQPRRQMIWDEENRLACSHENVQSMALPQTPASCDNAGGTPNDARYFYDDQGNRVVKDGAQFHMYPNRNFSTRGNQQYKHVYVGETKLLTKSVEPVQRIEDQQFYTHADHLGSTGFITDDQGGLAEHLQYFPGGETWVSEHPSQPVPQQFTGKELDPETNLYYYGARYYDPRTQEWQTPDPALESYLDGAPDGGVFHPMNLALYTYAYNDPLKLADPDGRFPWNRVMGGVKLVGGIAEAAAGAALGAATSWTGVGAVAGGVVAVHGVDVALSGARQLISGEETSSLTSSGLQAAGMSKDHAELVDSAISIVGSTGASLATSAIKSAAQAAPRAVAAVSEEAVQQAAPKAARSVADEAARIPCVGNSFAPNTLVLLANGMTKAIAAIQPGDVVAAVDPQTGEHGPRPVTYLITGQGVKHLVDVQIDGRTVTATDGHPFWVASLGQWVEAKDLRVGDLVLQANGHTARVDALRQYVEFRRVNNLTIDGLHTYFVMAGGEAILVHNAGPCSFGTGKPPHVANVTVTRNGETVVDTALRSGNMTAEEAALGFPKSSLATHTEARAATKIPLQAGDEMVIRGQYPPCPSCKGYMNRAAQQANATIRYEWPGGSWTARGSQ